MVMVLSGRSFELFRKLTDEEKEELRPHFKEIAKDLRLIIEWYKNNKGVSNGTHPGNAEQDELCGA